MRMVRDDGRSGKGRIVAFGRDLRASVALQRRLIEAQQAMERDYWRFREAETRYRHLFETSAEAVLIVDGADAEGARGQPGRARAVRRAPRQAGRRARCRRCSTPAQAERLQNLLAAARTRRPPATRCARGWPSGGDEVAVSASVFRQDDAAFVLVRLAVRTRAGRHAPAQRGLGAAAGRDRRRRMLQAYCAMRPTAWCSPTPTAACCRPTAPSSRWPSSAPRSRCAASRWTAGSAAPASTSAC